MVVRLGLSLAGYPDCQRVIDYFRQKKINSIDLTAFSSG
jgi:cobalamin biosynthesis Co2+ chelatase CbiK